MGDQTQQPQITPPIGSQQSVTTPPPLDPSTLDPSVVKVMHAIRHVESQGNYNAVGDNGASMGAFQWNNGNEPVKPGQTPRNWQSAAQQYLGSAQAPMTPENQNYVAYNQIKAYKDQGLTPISIDALWNGAKPDPMNPGQYQHVNPQRLSTFQQALQNEISGQPQTPTSQSTTPQSPSIGGFLQNVAGSAGNFLGNLATAIEHPINTVENLANIPIGGLQELGGESTPQTQEFDALKSYFGNRYSSPQAIAHTLYTDPVGLAADLSTVLGIGGGIAGLASKGADIAGLGSAAGIAGATGEAGEFGGGFASDIGATGPSGLAGGLKTTASNLGRAAVATNPLTPVVSAVGGGLGLVAGPIAKTVGALSGLGEDVIRNLWSGNISTSDVGEINRATLGDEVQNAIDNLVSQKEDTGVGYEPIRKITTPINVEGDFLDNQLREKGNLDVVDGKIKPTTTSKIGTSEVAKLQDIYNTFKPAFLKGQLTPEEFLALRTRLSSAAYSDSGIKNSEVARIVGSIDEGGIRGALNDTYRPQVQGLEELDKSFSAQKKNLQQLTDGLFYKTEEKRGQLMPTALSKIMSATKVGNGTRLAQLEQILPGITDRIKAAALVEKLTTSLEKGGGGIINHIIQSGEAPALTGGLITGNLQVAGGAVATMLLTSPKLVANITEWLGSHRPLMAATVLALSRVATMGAVASASNGMSSNQPQQSQSPQAESLPAQNTTQTTNQSQTPIPASPPSGSSQNNVSQSSAYQAAINAGYTPAEIEKYLANQQ